MSGLEKITKTTSQEEIKKAIAALTANDLYTPNKMELLPKEAEILQLYLDAAPEYLFVEMPEGYWTGDELGILKRHGFKLGTIAPFGDLFYECSRLLLSEKEVSVPVFTEEEVSLIKNAGQFTVTKKMLIEICHRHGYSRFSNGVSHSTVSIESNKPGIADGLMRVLIEKGLANESDLITRGDIGENGYEISAA